MSELTITKNKLAALRSKLRKPSEEATTVKVKQEPTEPVVASSATTNSEKQQQSEVAAPTTTIKKEKKTNNNPKANNKKKEQNATPSTSSEASTTSSSTSTTTPMEVKSTTSSEGNPTFSNEKPKPKPKQKKASTTTTPKQKKQGIKRKQPEPSSEEGSAVEQSKDDSKQPKKKNKNKKSKKAIKAAIKTFVLKIVNDNINITEDKVKECFPEQNSIVRMGPRLILIQFPTEAIAMTYLVKEGETEAKTRQAEIHGEKFKISKHTVREIFNPRWFDVKPRVTEGVSLGLQPGQKVNAKFVPYLELYLKEKLGNETNTTISDMEKGVAVFFEDAQVESKFKSMIESGKFKVPSEYFNDKKSKKKNKSTTTTTTQPARFSKRNKRF